MTDKSDEKEKPTQRDESGPFIDEESPWANVPCDNNALIFIKPHADTGSVRALVEKVCRDHELAIITEGDVSCEEVRKDNLADKHYTTIARFAMKGTAAKTRHFDDVLASFKENLKTDYATLTKNGQIYNAAEALVKFGNLSPTELNDLWKKNGPPIKITSGLYVEAIAEQGGVYVINGFYPLLKEGLETPGKRIHWYQLQWPEAKLTWKDFRSKVIGSTDPHKAEKDSLRQLILEEWKSLGLEEEPNTSFNGVHASASPLEGLAERMLWCKKNFDDDPLGKTVTYRYGDLGVELIKQWALNNRISLNDEPFRPSFDVIEGYQTSELLDVIEQNIKNDEAYLLFREQKRRELGRNITSAANYGEMTDEERQMFIDTVELVNSDGEDSDNEKGRKSPTPAPPTDPHTESPRQRSIFGENAEHSPSLQSSSPHARKSFRRVSMSALTRDSEEGWTDEEFKKKNEKIVEKWTRIGDLYTGQYSVGDALLPDDEELVIHHLEHGRQTDGFFYAALSALLRHPGIVRNLFVTKEVRRDGRYTFQFYRWDKWVKVEIDDWIPTIAHEPIFVRSPTKHWWPLLLEKAYAKFYGGYENIITGSSVEAMHDMTAMPVINMSLAAALRTRMNFQKEETWHIISNHLQENRYSMTIVTHADVKYMTPAIGLKECEVYGLMAVYILEHARGKTTDQFGLLPPSTEPPVMAARSSRPSSAAESMRAGEIPDDETGSNLTHIICKLYTPHRTVEYTGPYREGDEQHWTQEALDIIKPNWEHKNMIYVPLSVVLVNFMTIPMCYQGALHRRPFYFIGEWTEKNSGGNANSWKWRTNPIYPIQNTSDETVTVVATIKQPDQREGFLCREGQTMSYLSTGMTLAGQMLAPPSEGAIAAAQAMGEQPSYAALSLSEAQFTHLLVPNVCKLTHKGVYLNQREVSNEIDIPPHSLCYLVPATINAGMKGDYMLTVYVPTHVGELDTIQMYPIGDNVDIDRPLQRDFSMKTKERVRSVFEFRPTMPEEMKHFDVQRRHLLEVQKKEQAIKDKEREEKEKLKAEREKQKAKTGAADDDEEEEEEEEEDYNVPLKHVPVLNPMNIQILLHQNKEKHKEGITGDTVMEDYFGLQLYDPDGNKIIGMSTASNYRELGFLTRATQYGKYTVVVMCGKAEDEAPLTLSVFAPQGSIYGLRDENAPPIALKDVPPLPTAQQISSQMKKNKMRHASVFGVAEFKPNSGEDSKPAERGSITAARRKDSHHVVEGDITGEKALQEKKEPVKDPKPPSKKEQDEANNTPEKAPPAEAKEASTPAPPPSTSANKASTPLPISPRPPPGVAPTKVRSSPASASLKSGTSPEPVPPRVKSPAQAEEL